MVVCALVIVVALSSIVLRTTKPSQLHAIGLLTTATTAVAPALPLPSTNYESIGGCAEVANDHNHDVDPKGFVDQEDDECLPAQHASRLPDGQIKH
jgi:beta-lactamase regulating signal transducer with metallopeptidase domain